ncbi:MAG: bifunctional heptose 7-phosphate kinase/heptose 1-phosphate adenyltransferase [Phycisphaeraceae bacterium]|nr:bifunctional heptose 7-phosphate kinase/heptose 1-phosphate adenyltransferase [Phycisphaeraceae bacterium]
MSDLHTSLLEHLERFTTFRALVVGDFMLDQVLAGAAERLSPDAPVPVIAASEEEMRSQPGGAAGVAACLKAMGGEVRCAGVRGRDAAGERLVDLLRAAGCDASLILPDPSRPTTVKRSIVGLAQHRHPQKMFRLDFESRAPLSADLSEALLHGIEKVLHEVDIVCLEDYDKGVCTEPFCRRLVALCRAAGRPILVDPAAIRDYGRYRGATAITPNRTEAELATGSVVPRDFDAATTGALAGTLLERHDFDAVVLTLDRHGALLLERGGAPIHVPTVARTIYDVTGAGDMVLAALACAVAQQVPWPEAVAFANAAAGLEVEVFGAQPIPLPRVRRSVFELARGYSGKVRTLDDAAAECELWRADGRRVVLTNGCFDLLHAGHVASLRGAKAMGDVLVVGVNVDAQVLRMKGEGRPVAPLAERMEMLEALSCVDLVVPFVEPTAEVLLRRLRPDTYAKGGDYRPETLNEWPVLRELGIEVRLVPSRPGVSTTTIIDRILQGHVAASEKAARG